MPQKSCFVIAPIGEEDSDIRKRSDQVLKHVITPPFEKAGYRVVRADEMSEPGWITFQIVEKLIESEIVVADMTGQNPNVFLELGIRHSFQKPIIHIIQGGETIPFDVSAFRTIRFNHPDPDALDEARSELDKQIKEIEGGGPVHGLVRTALSMKQLDLGDESNRTLKDILVKLEVFGQGLSELLDEKRQRKITEDFLRAASERNRGFGTEILRMGSPGSLLGQPAGGPPPPPSRVPGLKGRVTDGPPPPPPRLRPLRKRSKPKSDKGDSGCRD